MRVFIATLFVLLFGCATRATPPAPVVDGVAQFAAAPTLAVKTTNSPLTKNGVGTDDSASTKITKLAPISSTDGGRQKIEDRGQITPTKPVAMKKSKIKESSSVVADNASDDNDSSASNVAAKNASSTRDGWMMPTKGNIVGKYSKAKKGIEIKSVVGSGVVAASDGKVVYSGNGLKGYGNLIILKHDNGYLTAYALNKVNLVKVGQNVKCGDKIAEVGDSGVLHFELRKDGKPINPNYIDGK